MLLEGKRLFISLKILQHTFPAMLNKYIWITIVCILVAAFGAPQIPPITEPPQATTELPAGAIKPNATILFVVGTDGRQRNITGTPCIKSECTLFYMCVIGTIQIHKNGLAYRGPDNDNFCPNYDDVCCQPDPINIEKLKNITMSENRL